MPISRRNLLALGIVFILALTLSCRKDTTDLTRIDSSFADPGMEYRPFVRWWWNGDRIEADELIRELHLLKEAGIGGVEINPIETPYGADTTGTRALRLLSDEWTDLLKVTFDEASRLGMRCDLLLGSGWPFGAETLPMDERASVVLLNAVQLPAGHFETTEEELCRAVDPGVTVPNPERRWELVRLLLVPDPINDLAETVDVSDLLVDGVFNLDVPEGPHYLYALVRYDSFACVINGAPGAAGSILNHFDKEAVRKYLNHQADSIEARIGPLSGYLRSFFVDSMELEGSNWCSDLPEEFRRRRGYDLMPWLPFTMFKVGRLGEVMDYHYGANRGEAFEDQVRRVRYDFELTKAELLHERYTRTFLDWCREKGVLSRAQAYGRGFFPLESSLGYDIPEGESWTTNWLRHRLGEEMGDSDYRRGRGYTMINKYVSSAANLSGKRIVSSEEMTNTYRVFNTSLELLKIGSDMGAFSGTTLPVWSGYNYSPKDAAFPGWVQYGSYSNEQNPWWPYFRLLNGYRARVSTVLTNTDMVTDIAILPANDDLWTELGVQTDPFPWYLNVPYTSLIWEAVHKNGGGADYISDSILEAASVRRGRLCYGPRSYSVLILPEVRTISPEAMETIMHFVEKGGCVYCIGCLPSCAPGLKDHETRDAAVRRIVARMVKRYPERFVLLEKAGDDAWLEWYAGIQAHYRLPHAVEIGTPDRFLLQNHYRTSGKSDFFLFSNVSLEDEKQTGLTFPADVVCKRNAVLYDPDSGQRFRLRGETLPDGAFRTELRLGPSQSIFISFLPGQLPELPDWAPLPTCGKDSRDVKDWQVRLDNPRTGITGPFLMESLRDLRELYPVFMGEARYETELDLPDSLWADGHRLYINLGKVCEIATLRINGREAGVRWWGEAVFDVTDLFRPGANRLEITVETLMGNYMRTLTDNPVVQRFLLGRKEQPTVAMGLLGPVTFYTSR
ncbi:MAG: glycoside hydrolase family 2 [Bacteroidales bacterium]|nr:glycoside hydrolase family 2 [Bacteroidales bacterium]